MTTGPLDPAAGAAGGLAGLNRPWLTIHVRSLRRFVAERDAEQARSMILRLLGAVAVLLFLPLRWLVTATGPTTWLAVAAVVAAIIGLTIASERSLRIEWDGQHVTMAALGRRRRVIGIARQGLVVRARFALRRSETIAVYWLDADGKVLGRTPEGLWNAEELASIVTQSRIPFVDEGTLDPMELHARHPGIFSGLLTRPLYGGSAAQRAASTRQPASPRFVLVMLAIVTIATFAFKLLGWT